MSMHKQDNPSDARCDYETQANQICLCIMKTLGDDLFDNDIGAALSERLTEVHKSYIKHGSIPPKGTLLAKLCNARKREQYFLTCMRQSVGALKGMWLKRHLRHIWDPPWEEIPGSAAPAHSCNEIESLMKPLPPHQRDVLMKVLEERLNLFKVSRRDATRCAKDLGMKPAGFQRIIDDLQERFKQ